MDYFKVYIVSNLVEEFYLLSRHFCLDKRFFTCSGIEFFDNSYYTGPNANLRVRIGAAGFWLN